MILTEFILGVLIIGIIDAFWSRLGIYNWEIDTPLEHYHFGLATLIVGHLLKNYYFLGSSLYFFLQEALGENPFAIGKRRFVESFFIAIPLILILLAVLIGG